MKKKNIYGGYDFDTWLCDDKVPKGVTSKNVELLRELKDVIADFGRNDYILYFLVHYLDIGNCRRMLNSGVKQRAYLRINILPALKERQVTSFYYPYLKKTISKYRERVDYVFKIIKENLKLTEYYLFFDQKDWDDLINVEVSHTEDTLIYIIEEFEEWKKNNQELLDEYMESIREEREIYYAFLNKKTEERQSLKKTQKQLEMAQKKFDRETAKQVAANDKADKKAEDAFNKYYHIS